MNLGQPSSAVTQCGPGVPLGSVLGRLLFTAYRDLIEAYDISYHTFADDTQLLVVQRRCTQHSTVSPTARGYTQVVFHVDWDDLLLNAEV